LKKLTSLQWVAKVQDKYPEFWEEYTLITPYINKRSKIKVKHMCGHIYEAFPRNFTDGYRCGKCANNIKIDTDEFKNRMLSIDSRIWEEYKLISRYKTSDSKVEFKHMECNHTFNMSPSSFKAGRRCPSCYGNKRYATKEWVNIIDTQYPNIWDKYTLLSSYRNAKIKVYIKHNMCNKMFSIRPNDFQQGERCPYCSSPKGERLIMLVLDNNNISYDIQKRFNNLRDASMLSYDFYIPKYKMLIEYQGIQHFKPVAHFNEDYFATQNLHDDIKREYAKNNSLELLEIPYTINSYMGIEDNILDKISLIQRSTKKEVGN